VIAGTFFLCGAPPEENHFTSLTNQQLSSFPNALLSRNSF
jgi:hypothetical protein